MHIQTYTKKRITPNAINHVLIKWTITALNMNTYEYLFTIKLTFFYMFIVIKLFIYFFMCIGLLIEWMCILFASCSCRWFLHIYFLLLSSFFLIESNINNNQFNVRFKCTCMSDPIFFLKVRACSFLYTIVESDSAASAVLQKEIFYAQWFFVERLKSFQYIYLSTYLSIYNVYKCDWVSVLCDAILMFLSFFLSLSLSWP